MPKHYKDMIDELINKMPVEEGNLRYSVKYAYQKGGKIANAFYKDKADAEKFMKSVIAKGGKAILTTEDAPANAVAHGGVDMAPNAKGRAKHDKGKYKDDNEKTTDILRRTIMKKLGNNVKENTDNNNVVLKGVNETLTKLEKKIDEFSGNDEEVKVVPEKDTFHDKFIKDLADNTPHAGQFDEKL